MAKIGEILIDFKTQLATFKADIDGAKKSLGDMRTFVKDNSQGFRDAGMAIGAMSVALVALGTKGVMASVAFEKQLAMVGTMLDDTSRKYMPEYSKGLERLAVTYGESTATLSKGLYDILSAAIPAGEAMGVLEAGAKIAKAGFTDTATATSTLITVLNAYQLSGEKAGDVSDWMFATVKRGVFTFEEFSGAVGKVLPISYALGVSLEEVGAMMATMTRAGLNADESATALRGVLMELLKPSKEGAEIFKKWGYETGEMAVKSIGLRGVLEKLTGTSSTFQSQLFGNVRAITGIKTALNDATGFMEDLNQLTNRAGTTQEAFAIATNTVTFSFEVFAQKVEMLFKNLGDMLLPTVQRVIDIFSGFISMLTNMNSGVAGFIVSIGGAVAVLGMLASPMLLFLSYVPKMIAGYQAISGAIAMLTVVTNGYLIIIIAVTAGALLIASAIDGLGTSLNKGAEAQLAFNKGTQGKIEWYKEEIKMIDCLIQKNSDNLTKVTELLEQKKKHEASIVSLTEKLNAEAQANDKVKLTKEAVIGAVEAGMVKTKEQMALEQQQMDLDVIMNKKTLEDKLYMLAEHLTAVKGNAMEELKTKREMYAIEVQLFGTAINTIKGGYLEALKLMSLQRTNWANEFIGLGQTIQNGLSTVLNNMLQGTANFAQSIEGIFNVIKNAVIQKCAEILASQIVKGVFSFLAGGTGLGAALGVGALMLGMAGSTGTGSSGGGSGIIAEKPLTQAQKDAQLRSQQGHIGGFADGGIATKPMIARLAEKEPEAIIPFSKMGGMGNSFGDIKVDVAIGNFSSSNPQESLRQIAEAVKQGIPEGIQLAKAVSKVGEKFKGESY